ncbi:uncharacterized protein [Parasteatoda tepidariorum]|uniref:Uncharacterized protein n=1 Tax=Parasteatoda tepidariorum TaxID=114398 RepID=A0A2L2YC89_PARTP|nr:uncharacterized protein LOC107447872 [Parasteatoda tepidariorum]
MAEFNRSLSIPVEIRNRPRSHVTCPRCRVDPSHISRQIWENSTRPQQQFEFGSNNNIPESRNNSNGYPDLCRRSNRSYTSPASVHHYQNVRPLVNVPTGHLNSASNVGSMRYSSDTHSTRSAGDTWRIRGILENHPPDVTRRAESSLGRLPDVTHHTQTNLSIQHARTRSVPVGGVYDSRVPSNSSYDIHHQHQTQAVSRSSTQGIICARTHQDGLSHSPMSSSATINSRQHEALRTQQQRLDSSNIATPQQWKREHTSTISSSTSPWVTRNAHIGRQTTTDTPSSSTQNPSNSLTWSNSQQTNNNCWRPSTVTSPSQNVLTQCPLPDLVTPRRQARKQCCGLLATHSVAIRWLVVVIACLGLMCSVVGTIVGVVKATGREHLTVALLLIGLGIVLVSMSGVAWRLTSRDSPSCRAMFGLRRTRHEPHRRFVPRVPHYGRPHPFSAMLYPDITLRPPPPSYQASMQEYRLRLLLMDRQTPPITHPPPPTQAPPPPPPMYRGPATVYPRFPVSVGISDYSRPPSYRSRPSSAGQPSPVGPEEVDIINNPTTSSSHLPSDVISTRSSSSPAAPQNRSAPSIATASNHVEVVAQV